NSIPESPDFDKLVSREHGLLRRIIACLAYIGMTQSYRQFRRVLQMLFGDRESREAIAKEFFDFLRGRPLVSDDLVESPEKGLIQHGGQVGRGNDNAIRIVML